MKSLIETMKEKLRKNFSENLILNLLYLTLSGGIIYIFFNEENYIESIKNGYIGLYFVLILLGGLFQKPPSDFKLKNPDNNV